MSWFCFWEIFFPFVVFRAGLHYGVDTGYFVVLMVVMLVMAGVGFRGDARGGWY